MKGLLIEYGQIHILVGRFKFRLADSNSGFYSLADSLFQTVSDSSAILKDNALKEGTKVLSRETAFCSSDY